jgi:phage terminase large subunit-like protein
MRILLLGLNHSSVINSYCIGLERQGLEHKAISFDANRLKYVNYDKIETIFKRGITRIETLIGIVKLCIEVRKCDIIHIFSEFTVPSRLNNLVSKFLYNRKGVKYFVTFTGSDVRDPEIELAMNPFFKYAYLNPLYEGKDFETRHNSTTRQFFFSSRGFRLIANPEIVPFVVDKYFQEYFLALHASANFVNLSSQEQKKQLGDRPIRIVHAPSSPIAKGTNFVLEAIHKLENKWGNKVEFKLLSGLTNSEYQTEVMDADILIDQLIWGWYGIAAQQALEMSKAVICYLSEERLKLVPSCPIINANIQNLFEVLDELMSNKGRLNDIGGKGRNFYLQNHSPDVVIKTVLNYYGQ